MKASPEELITQREAIEYLGLSPSLLAQWEARGKPVPKPWYRKGKVVLYRIKDVDEFALLIGRTKEDRIKELEAKIEKLRSK